VLGPNVSALAQAAWTQEVWNKEPFQAEPAGLREAGAVGGTAAAFPNNAIADTEDQPLYQTVRYNMSAYHLPLGNGTYRVTLKFCEPHYAEAGKRVFNVRLQGQPVIERLDVFARVGQNRALDFNFDNVAVTNGWVDLEFEPVVEFPAIAAIAIEGAVGRFKINCGGPAYKDFASDAFVSTGPAQKFAATDDFYRDWAASEFGPELAEAAGRLFEKVDCKLPRPSDWTDGPGGLKPDPRPWEQVQAEYAFVLQFEQLSPRVRGAGNRERFDYWLATFRYLRAMGEINCAWARYNAEAEKARKAADPATAKHVAEQTLLPLRRALVGHAARAYTNLLATVSTTGELGTIMNWEQHIFPGLLTIPGEELADWLGRPLPADAQLRAAYRGPTRIVVPALRTSYEPSEPLALLVRVLAETPPREATVKWRKLGARKFNTTPLQPVARSVYRAQFPPEATAAPDLEYFVEMVASGGETTRFPATAPALNQALVRLPLKW
jgi:hypothetical protein